MTPNLLNLVKLQKKSNKNCVPVKKYVFVIKNVKITADRIKMCV